MVPTAPGTDIQVKPITSAFIDNIFQDTWILALAIKNIPGVVVDKALYQHCVKMVERVQEKLYSAGASDILADEIKFAHCVFLDEAVAAVIRSQAPNTQVKVIPHHPVWMPVAERARLSISGGMTLGERPILGDEVEDANYCMRIEMSTEDAGEVKGWMPHGQLRRDVFELLKTYLGCDYDASLYLTVQVRLLPRPRLGDPDLFSGYNIMLGLRDDNEDQIPQTMRMRVGKLRGRDFDEE